MFHLVLIFAYDFDFGPFKRLVEQFGLLNLDQCQRGLRLLLHVILRQLQIIHRVSKIIRNVRTRDVILKHGAFIRLDVAQFCSQALNLKERRVALLQLELISLVMMVEEIPLLLHVQNLTDVFLIYQI